MLNIKLFPDLYSPHTSQIYSGLYNLAKQGRIGLKVTARFDEKIKKSVRNSVLCLQIHDSESSNNGTICFDLFDGCEISSIERLRLSDVYFKRSYNDVYINKLDTDDRNKILPYGLNYECRSRNENDILKRLLIFNLARDNLLKNPIESARNFSTELLKYILLKYNIRKFRIKPMSIDDFVVKPSEPSEFKILFQTRLWTAQECPRISHDRLKEINDMRANTIRSLRKRFGKLFIGGLIHTDYAKKHYTDCLSPEKADRKNYMNLVKKCLICITTKGLHDSTGFKLPEYLAASRCIVTEPLKYRLPVALQEGRNYLSFRTPEECVKACETILDDVQFSNQMRHENYKYYLNEVEPTSLIDKCLKTAIYKLNKKCC